MKSKNVTKFLLKEFETLLENYLPYSNGSYWLGKDKAWTKDQIQCVREWIERCGYAFSPEYTDRLEAADLTGRPFMGDFKDSGGYFSHAVLVKLITLRDRNSKL